MAEFVASLPFFQWLLRKDSKAQCQHEEELFLEPTSRCSQYVPQWKVSSSRGTISFKTTNELNNCGCGRNLTSVKKYTLQSSNNITLRIQFCSLWLFSTILQSEFNNKGCRCRVQWGRLIESRKLIFYSTATLVTYLVQ